MADISWFFILFIFSLGAGLGAFAYHLAQAGTAELLRTKQQLSAKEEELTHLKEELNTHFSRTADGFSAMAQQLQALEQQAREDAERLRCDDTVLQRLKLPPSTPQQAALEQLENSRRSTQQPAHLEAPRDYSDPALGRGTLSEEFGLKPEIFEPPRN